MSYAAALHAEQFYLRGSDERRGDYLLVFVCCHTEDAFSNTSNTNQQATSTQQRNSAASGAGEQTGGSAGGGGGQSILASLFAKNAVRAIPLPHAQLRKYLHDKLKNDQDDDDDSDKSVSTLLPAVTAVISQRSGNGKSTFVRRYFERIGGGSPALGYKIARIKASKLNMGAEVVRLMRFRMNDTKARASVRSHRTTIYHVDIAYETLENVDQFLFGLIVTGCLRHPQGLVWRRGDRDLFLVEITPPYLQLSSAHPADGGRVGTDTGLEQGNNGRVCLHTMVELMPRVELRSPKMYLYDLINEEDDGQVCFFLFYFEFSNYIP